MPSNDDLPPLHTGRRLLGEIGDLTVVILDISLLGALVEHYGELAPGLQSTLTFHLRDRDHSFACRVDRSVGQRFADKQEQTVIFHSEIRFEPANAEEEADLRELVNSSSSDVMTARMVNAFSTEGVRVDDKARHAAQLLEPREAADSAYLELRLIGDLWVRTYKLVPSQPADGFAVSSYEDAEQVELLCRAYEEADEEGRDLIRQFAGMSLSEPSQIPPRAFSE